MSGVSNGDVANETTFDDAYMDRTGDTDTSGVVGLLNTTDPNSGVTITNTQRKINEVCDSDGTNGEGDPNRKVYSSTNFIDDGDNRKVAIGKLDLQLGSTQSQLDLVDAANSVDVTVGPIGSSPNADGATITGQVLNLQPADSSNGGVLTNTIQSITGSKTFLSDLIADQDFNVNGNTILNGDLTVNGTQTVVNSDTVDTLDPNITVNKTGNDASSEGAGITVDRTGTKGSFKYQNALASKFKIGDLGSEAEVVTVSHTQTLTNKTLTSPAITTPTGIVSSDVGLGNVTNDSQLKRAANDFNTFTEKTTLVDDDVFIIEDSADSGAKKFVKKSNLGASGSGGVQNLITNGDAESAVASIFVPYQDSSGSRPSDGNGGTTTGITTSVTSTNPLSKLKSYLLTKDAANRQGGGWAIPFTVDLSYRAKVLSIDIDYIVNSGTFVAGTNTTDSDVIWYLYDVTNSQLIEPSSIKLLSNSSTITDKFRSTFQTSATGSSYRLIAHVATTSTAAYELKVEVSVSPSNYTYGTPITDWFAYTSVVTGLGTVSLEGFYARRVGDSGEIKGTGVAGTPTAVALSFSLPSSWNVDPNKNPTTTNTASHGHLYNTSFVGSFPNASNGPLAVFSDTAVNANLLYVANSTSGSRFDKDLGNALFATSDRFRIEASGIPILGFSSSVQMSEQTDTRIVDFRIERAATATSLFTAGVVKHTYDVAPNIDSHGGWDSGNNRYIIQVAGDYLIEGAVYVSAVATAHLSNLRIRQNGNDRTQDVTPKEAATSINFPYRSKTLIKCNVGDFIELFFDNQSGSTLNSLGTSTANVNRFIISRVSGPNQIAASESMNARASSSAGQAIAANSATVIDFASKTYDTHGSWSTNTWTCLTSGKFAVKTTIGTQSVTLTTSQGITLFIHKNGTQVAMIDRKNGTGAATTYAVSGGDTIQCVAGDTITIRLVTNAALSLDTDANYVHVAIEKVG